MRLFLSLFFCTLSSPALGAPPPPPKAAVIFLPGYLGSFLRDSQTKERVFITLRSALHGPGALSLYQKELATPEGPAVEPDGVMDYVPALFSKVDVYGSLLEQLRTLPDTLVVGFDWDWRKDPFESVLRLDALVASLRSHGITQIDFVAHSAGGWLASYYLAYGAQAPANALADWSGARQVRRLVLLGTPFRGGLPLFRELSRGSSLPLMGHLLPADAMASFPSIYCATPLDAGHFLDEKGKPLDVTLADPAAWSAYHLGLLARTDLAAPYLTARATYLQQWLSSCGRFVDRIQMADAPAAPLTLRSLSVTGTGTKTLDKAFLVGPRGTSRLVLDVDSPGDEGLDESLLFTDGDGIVPAGSSALPASLGAHAELHGTRLTHEKLPTDPEVQIAILSFLRAP